MVGNHAPAAAPIAAARVAALIVALLLTAAAPARDPAERRPGARLSALEFETRIGPPPTGNGAPMATDAGDGLPGFLGDRSLERIDRLIAGGALGLASSLLIDLRAGTPDDPGWQQFERRLWDVMGARKEWSALADRIESIESDLPRDFALDARTRAATARMEAGQYARARDILRRLLLDTRVTDPARPALWRRMITRSYFLEGRIGDVTASVVRFQRDYYPDDDPWNLFRARTLLLSGQPAQAVSQVAAVAGNESALLQALGRMRSGVLTPNQAIDSVSALIEGGMADAPEAWGVMAEAGLSAVNLPIAVRALERLLVLRGEPAAHALTPYRADDLVRSSERLARQIGNAEHLLVGDDSVWLDAADRLRKEMPEATRALYLFVARHGSAPAAVHRAQTGYADALEEHGLMPLIQRLYGPGRPLGDYSTLDAGLALRLSERAIEEGDIQRAAALSSPLVTPPPAIDPFQWTLRRARLDIFAGRHESGSGAIAALIGRQASFSEEQVDRILQPIFDLQSVERHDLALSLFEPLYGKAAGRQRREILFWMAESMQGTGRDVLAAELYLRSATAVDNGYDLWGQTARYQAAEAMTRARLPGDARAIYEDLLRVTREPQRRAQIERKLQQLWLYLDTAAADGSD
jgi:hypothetical protein